MVTLPDGSAAFFAGNLAAVVASHGIVESFFAGREISRRWLAGCSTYIFLTGFDLLLVGTLGMLQAWHAAGLMILLACASVAFVPFLRPRFRNSEVEDHVLEPASQDIKITRLLATAMFTLSVGGLLLRVAFQSPKWFNDDFAYHATNVVQWVLDKRISVGAMNDHAYWPLNNELVPLWLVLPFKADGMALWCGIPWLIVVIVAMVSLARSQGFDWSIGLLTAAMVAASPNLVWMLRTFSAADFAGPAMLLAAIAFLAPPFKNRNLTGDETSIGAAMRTMGRQRMVDIVFSGLAAGFAIGCKIPFVFPVAVLGLWIVFAREPGLVLTGRIKRAFIFSTAVIATGIFWYARNLILTGNPLFPGKVGPFEGPLTLDNAQITLFQWMRLPPPRRAWLGFAESYLGSWPLGLALLALVGFAGSVQYWFKRREIPGGSVRLMLSLCFFVLLITHPFMPLSGPYPADSPNPHFVSRYINSAFILGMALTAPLLSHPNPRKWLWLTWSILSVAITWPGPGKSVLILNALALAVVTLVYCLPSRFYSGPLRGRIAFYALTLLILAGMIILAPRQQRVVNRYILEEYSAGPDAVGAGWNALENLPAGSRIAWFDNYGWEYYPIYGRRWQLTPYRVNRDGTPFLPVHLNWRTLIEGPADSPQVVQNLLSGKAQYVFISKHRSTEWPPQYTAVSNAPQMKQVYQDGYSAIFEIVR